MIGQSTSHGFNYGIQLVILQTFQKASGNPQCIHIGVIIGQSQNLTIVTDKSRIKIRIVSHQNGAFAEIHKSRQDHRNIRGIFHHSVIDARQFLDFKRNGSFRINKFTELLRDDTILHLDGTDFDDTVIHRTESRCLNIKNDKRRIQALPSGVRDNIFDIIHQIPFHAVNDLKVLALYTVIGIRESLNNTMICNGHGLMSPSHSRLQKLLHIRYAIHIAHGGMAMQLHTLNRAVIHAFLREIRNGLNTGYRTKGNIMLKLVHHGNGLHFDESPFL